MGDSASKGGSVLLERPESVLSPPDFEPTCIWKATKRKKKLIQKIQLEKIKITSHIYIIKVARLRIWTISFSQGKGKKIKY